MNKLTSNKLDQITTTPISIIYRAGKLKILHYRSHKYAVNSRSPRLKYRRRPWPTLGQILIEEPNQLDGSNAKAKS